MAALVGEEAEEAEEAVERRLVVVVSVPSGPFKEVALGCVAWSLCPVMAELGPLHRRARSNSHRYIARIVRRLRGGLGSVVEYLGNHFRQRSD